MSEASNETVADPDVEIRQLLRLGNVDAMAMLWDHYGDTLHRLLLSILGSPADADDTLQDLFVKIAKKRMALAESKSIPAYLYQMCRNAGIDAFRKTKKHRQKHSGDESLQYVQALPTAKKLDPELLQQINTGLGELPEEQRSVVMLKIYDQKTFYEISEILDISPNTCASRYRYGMDKLREMLKGMWP